MAMISMATLEHSSSLVPDNGESVNAHVLSSHTPSFQKYLFTFAFTFHFDLSLSLLTFHFNCPLYFSQFTFTFGWMASGYLI